ISAPDVAVAAQEVRSLLAAWQDKRDLIAIGAYEPGSDPLADRAIALKPAIDEFLRQAVDAPSSTGDADDGLLALAAEAGPAGLGAGVAPVPAAPAPAPVQRSVAYPPSGPVALPPLNLGV